MIRAIFAVDRNGGLGKSNGLPWPHDKEDMLWFKKHTNHQIVVMGSATWNSSMPTPLPNRVNVVVSRNGIENFKGATAVIHPDNLAAELKYIEHLYTDKDIWIIGGAKLLELSKPVIREAYVTHFHNEYDCDTFIDLPNWLQGTNIQEESYGRNKTFRVYIWNHI